MFILHRNENGTRNVGVIIAENDTQYQTWFGGTLNRKPTLYWVNKKECTKIHKTCTMSHALAQSK
jgi:coproporphyrinogen III oxidase